jgi:hypothetical protein
LDDTDIDGKVLLTYVFKIVCENVTELNGVQSGPVRISVKTLSSI